MASLFNLNDTIVATCTPVGVGGIAIIRLSGENAVKIADTLFVAKNGKIPSQFNKRELVLGEFTHKNFADTCLAVVFSSNSFTGEPTVEFQSHGGIKVANSIVNACINNGARLAKNGEFSLRAVLNGKMKLCDAEGMIDMINAESDAELRAGKTIMSGGLTQKVEEFKTELTDLIAEVEVSFDYPEEDIEYIAKNNILNRSEQLIQELEQLISTYNSGAIIKNGINACLIGKPNVGKSSLLNALLNKNKAIVTEIAGTTRDVIEDAFEINGIKVNILDTAGIRSTKDIVERLGVERSVELINQADIVLFITDSSLPLDQQDKHILSLLSGKKYLTVHNKADMLEPSNKTPNGIYTSCKTGEGIEKLKQEIYNSVVGKTIMQGGLTLTNARHVNCLKRAKDALINAKQSIGNLTLDLVSVDLNEAFVALGEVTGDTSNEAILDSIFSKFCLGK